MMDDDSLGHGECSLGGLHSVSEIRESPDHRIHWCWKCGKTWELEEA